MRMWVLYHLPELLLHQHQMGTKVMTVVCSTFYLSTPQGWAIFKTVLLIFTAQKTWEKKACIYHVMYVMYGGFGITIPFLIVVPNPTFSVVSVLTFVLHQHSLYLFFLVFYTYHMFMDFLLNAISFICIIHLKNIRLLLQPSVLSVFIFSSAQHFVIKN